MERPTWRAVWLPVALVLVSLALLVAVPWVTQRRALGVQDEILDTISPARDQLTRVQQDIASETAGTRGFLLTGDERFAEEQRQARARRDIELPTLLELSARLGPAASGLASALADDLHKADPPIDAFFAGRLSREDYLALLPSQQAMFQVANARAADLDELLSDEAAARRRRIASITRTGAWIETALVLLALVAIADVAILGRRYRALAGRLDRYGRRQSALKDAARALSQVGSVREAVVLIAHRAMQEANASGAYVERSQSPESGGMVEVVASVGEGGPAVGTRIPYPGSLSEEIIESGEAQFVSEVGAIGERVAPYLRETCRGCTGLVMPLTSEGKILGALVLLRGPSLPHFTDEEMAASRALGDLASAALRRVLLLDQLAESDRRFRMVTDHLRQVIWLGTPDLSERYFVNPACEDTFGLTREEFIRTPLAPVELVHPDDRERVVAALRQIPHRQYDERYRIIRPDGQVRWIWSRVYPIWNEAGEATLVAGVMEDVTEYQAANEERDRLVQGERAARARAEEARAEAEWRREELERVSQSRTRLIRGFGHDLKNPLGAADGYLQLMERQKRDPLTEGQRERIEKVRRSLHAALDLIERLLSLARAQGSEIALVNERFDLRQEVATIAEEHRAQAEGAGLELRIDRSGGRAEVVSDRTRLRQLMGNLLSNAVKYTDRGWIRVRVDGPEDGWTAVHVSDTGRGLSEEERAHVFEEFRRARSAAGQRGAGIGLAISQAIAHAMGGEITVVSELDKGSTFTIRLPVVPIGSEAVPPAPLH